MIAGSSQKISLKPFLSHKARQTISLQVMINSIYRKHGKEIFDTTISFILLLFIFPLISLIYCIVRRRLGSPVFFIQERIGKHARKFFLIKFRTMNDDKDSEGNLKSDLLRLTSLGRFLRATSLDELPELLNVLRGEMSLVGPRPLLVNYLPLYSNFQMRRHEAQPGITGWAQINGRNAISWQKKFELDVWYVDHQSFWLDLKILFLTFWKVINRSDITQAGQATVEPFNGKN